MQAANLRPAGQLAQRFGVKGICYGGPGSGKTPMCNTAPRPVMLVCEPGMLSMRGSTIPAFEAFDYQKVNEFFEWFFKSNESKAFDTLIIDSLSEMSEIYLSQEKGGSSQAGNQKHGLKAYGGMAEKVLEKVNQLFFYPNKYVWLIAKQQFMELEGVQTKMPYFPGKVLNVEIPHKFDLIVHAGQVQIPQFVQPVNALRCKPIFGVFARDRSGNLNEIEPPNLTELFNKCLR